MPKRFINYDQITMLCGKIHNYVTTYTETVDYVVGISRGGLVPGVILSHMFKQPNFKVIQISLRDSMSAIDTGWSLARHANEGKKILIVDDIFDSGATYKYLSDDWTRQWYDIAWENVFMTALFARKMSDFHIPDVDYYADEAWDNEWICFPWEQQSS